MQPLARLSVILFFATVALAQPAYKPAPGRTLLRAGHVLDVHTGKEAAAQSTRSGADRCNS